MNEPQNRVNYNYFSVILGNCGNCMRRYLWLYFVSCEIVEQTPTRIKNYAWLISPTFPDSSTSFWTHHLLNSWEVMMYQSPTSWDLSCAFSLGGSFLIQELLRLSSISSLSVPSPAWFNQQLRQSLTLTPANLQLHAGLIQFSSLGWFSPPLGVLVIAFALRISISVPNHSNNPSCFHSLQKLLERGYYNPRSSWPLEKLMWRGIECWKSFKANSQSMDYRGERLEMIWEKGERETRSICEGRRVVYYEQHSKSILPGHTLFPWQQPISPKQDNVSG